MDAFQTSVSGLGVSLFQLRLLTQEAIRYTEGDVLRDFMPITFPLTVTSIKTQWERRGFPCVLDADSWEGIVDEAIQELQNHSPIEAFAKFNTVQDQTDYLVYDPADPVTQGVCANALQIHDVLWNPGGDWSSLNLFSPGWQLLSNVLLFTGSYFHEPSQMMVLRQKLNAWKQQFGSQGFELLGMPGSLTGAVRLFPIPLEDGSPVIVTFSKKYGLSDVTEPIYRYFRQWVDYYAAEALAAFFSQTAGIEVLGFTDSREASRYWKDRADKYNQRAVSTQAGMSGQADRT